MKKSMERCKIGQLYIYPFASRKELIDFALKEKKILIAVNAEKILKTEKTLIQLINQNVGYADGIGAVKALKQKKIKNAIKIPGVELWLDIIRQCFNTHTFYLIGSTDEVINETVNKLRKEFGNITILGYHSGYFDDNEKEKIKTDISQKKPDIIFVAMGSPRQEYFMNELYQIHKALYMGLGGSFDVYTGKVKRAPKLFVILGLEWFYRLIKQPRRIKRQIHLVRFLFKLMLKKL